MPTHPPAQLLYPDLEEIAKQATFHIMEPCELSQELVLKPLEDPLHPLRLTQLLSGESVNLVQEKEGMGLVEALLQPVYREGKFVPMRGWVPLRSIGKMKAKAELLVTSEGAVLRTKPEFEAPPIGYPLLGSLAASYDEWGAWHLVQIGHLQGWIHDRDVAGFNWMQDQPKEVWRWQWTQSARRFQGASYVWGGLGKIFQRQFGLDCSGLTHLVARRLGLVVARNSRDLYLWMKASFKLLESAKEVKEGDLLFLSDGSDEFIDHVMIVAEGGHCVESTRSCGGYLDGNRIGEILPGQVYNGKLLNKQDHNLRKNSSSRSFFSSLQMKNLFAAECLGRWEDE